MIGKLVAKLKKYKVKIASLKDHSEANKSLLTSILPLIIEEM